MEYDERDIKKKEVVYSLFAIMIWKHLQLNHFFNA